MTPKPRLLLATENPGKVRELEQLLAPLALEILTPQELGLSLNVPEEGCSYAENAIQKARAWSAHSGLPCLADDSGLEVQALGGAPGLHSARYLNKPQATDADRRAHLLQNLRGLPRPWLARFCATVALCLPEGQIHLAEGFCPGEIIPAERGSGGFGYDPIFWLPEEQKTMAELSAARKNEISHRARAIQQAFSFLRSLP